MLQKDILQLLQTMVSEGCSFTYDADNDCIAVSGNSEKFLQGVHKFVNTTNAEAEEQERTFELSEKQVDDIFDSMPDGALGFARTWGYRQFTQEVLKAAKSKSDGWIEWNGGKCPVQWNRIVEVKLRDVHANWPRHRAGEWRWSHLGDGTDIVAYRLIK